jgi:hypothetical protein
MDPFKLQNREYAHRLEIRRNHESLTINQGGAETKAAFEALLGPSA